MNVSQRLFYEREPDIYELEIMQTYDELNKFYSDYYLEDNFFEVFLIDYYYKKIDCI